MLASIQLAADQQRDRRQISNDLGDDRSSESSYSSSEEPTLLELPTRSYTLPRKPTEQENEAARQRQLRRTQESLSPTTTREADGSPDTETNEASSRSTGGKQGRVEQTWERLQQAIRQQELAAKINQERALETRTAEISSAADEASGSVASNAQGVQRLQRMWRALSVAEAMSGWGIFLLVIQLNLQVINHYFYKSKAIPPASPVEIIGCACLDAAACAAQFFCCFVYLWPMVFVVWALEHKWEAFTGLFGTLFKGIF
jgi:hypothetical protein